MSLLRHPLIHCLLLGFVVYLLYLVSGAGAQDDRSILVTKEKLLTFMQYRARAFDQQRVERAWKVMSPEDKERLIADYVREEVLYREARALELSNEDFVIRQRLIQKAEYLIQSAEEAEPLPDAELQTYFAAQRERYFQPASVTFSHVFVKQDVELAAVEASLDQISKADALKLGDRFPYHRNYSDSSFDEVAAHFGRSFANELLNVTPGDWQGPIKSAYGFHFVMVENIGEGRYPALAEVRDKVVADATRERDELALAAAVADLKQRYEITVDIE